MLVLKNNKRKGFSAIIVVILMLVLAVTGTAVSSFISSGMFVSMGQIQSTRAFYIAEAGLEWANRAITYVSGSASSSSGGRRITFNIRNNTNAAIVLRGLTATWNSPTAYYEQVRVGSTTVWNYSGSRAASGQNIVFTTPATVPAGATRTVALREFKTQQAGGGSNANMSNTNFRVAFNFTQGGTSSKNFGGGTFTISVASVSATDNANYTSTASYQGFSRVGSAASVCAFNASSGSPWH